MNKLLEQYLKSPCGTLSIPYWKNKSIAIPAEIKIVHDRDFIADDFVGYSDETYFRLYHDLKNIDTVRLDGAEFIVGATDRPKVFADIINASYDDISVTTAQMEDCLKTPVFDPSLWVLLKDDNADAYIGSGIADCDDEIGEAVIEWVQVLPQYRGRGYGRAIVNRLLAQMQGKARFATVSGKVNNPTAPERLYRKCGFTGDDVWHVLKKTEA